MRIVVTGASGLLGSALVPALRADGHDVVTLVRRAPATASEFFWDPERGELDPGVLDGVDATVHLAGAGVGDRRWTAEYRRVILDSRVHGTRLLAAALAERTSAGHPVTLLSASGAGWYGTHADDPVDESAPAGDGFLADVVRAWEDATLPAADAGSRVCLLRTAPVLAGTGGVLARQLPLYRLGLGGKLGSGRQWLSWISLTDWVDATRFLLTAGAVRGPVNMASPNAVTAAEFAQVLAGVLRRPGVLPVPRLALKAVVGGFTDEGVLASQHLVPRVLLDAGFVFTHPDLASALRAAVGSGRPRRDGPH